MLFNSACRLNLARSVFLVLILLSGCRPVDITKDLEIQIDLNIFKTFVSFRFADAETGELIGKSDGTTVQLSFGGRDADAVVTQTGERLSEHISVLGMISVALDPYDPYRMVPGHPVRINFTARAPGYADTQAALTLSETGTQVCFVSMRKAGFSAGKPQLFRVKPGEITEGLVAGGFKMITPGNLFELDFPDSLLLEGADGNQGNGPLDISALLYNRLAETPAGGNTVMDFLIQGIVVPGMMNPETILSLGLRCSNPDPLTQLPEKPIALRFTVGSGFQPGDSIPVWCYNTPDKLWESAGNAAVIMEDTTRFATLPISHFGLFAAGPVIPARVVTGEVELQFSRPFEAADFPGTIIIADALTGDRVQTVPITVSSGSHIPLTLTLPLGSAVKLTLKTVNPDFEFSAQPAYLTILPDQLTFAGSFILTPSKCRLSGSVYAEFPPDFNGYPAAGIIRITDAVSGSLLLSNTIQITAPGFSKAVSVMVHDNRPVNIQLIPAALSGDFISTPLAIREEVPCQDNGSWHFVLADNICRVQTTIRINMANPPRENVPAEILLLRASDRTLIKKMSVALAPSSTVVELESTVPKNTPVLIVLRSASSTRPFETDPKEFLWESPCSTPLSPVFTVTPGFAQLTGQIRFTLNSGLLFDEIPIRILTYTLKNEQLISSIDYQLLRSDPVITINQFTPPEPLFLKITRGSSHVRFNPEPFKIQIPNPSVTPEYWTVSLSPTVLLPVHFLVTVSCPKGQVLPTVQGYYRVPGEDWHEMNIISGDLTITVELGLTYEVGMILSGVMIDSVFTVDKQENRLNFDLEPADCEKMGWGKNPI